MEERVLVINPGSTSTKIAIFDGENELIRKTLRHSDRELSKFGRLAEQYEYRRDVVIDFLKENNIELKSISAVAGRGGLLEPMVGGTYLVNELMCETLREARNGEHASNLGALIAKAVADMAGVNAYIVDPVIVDEMDQVARYSGHPLFKRLSIFHALNQKAVARIVANKLNKAYEDCNFVVAHIGGGISVGAHRKGRVVDVNNALDGEGPFSPERSGTLPSRQLVDLCFSGRYTKDEICKFINGNGGILAYLGTNDMRIVDIHVAEGDRKTREVYEAMAYQVAKYIGCMAVVLEGEIDRIIITGGVVYDKLFAGWLLRKVSFIAPVELYPGEEELKPLATGVIRVLRGIETAREYNR